MSSFSIEGSVQNPFLEEAQQHTCLMLMRSVFDTQVSEFASILSEGGIEVPEELSVQRLTEYQNAMDGKHILKRRNVSAELQSQKRLLDDTEITILGLLDSSGVISQSSRVSDLLVLMTRVVKSDHRALCLHIAGQCMTEECGKLFVSMGGLRLLKRWVSLAEDEGAIDELRGIVSLCKRLPFDKVAAKESGIGIIIKQLKKKFPKDKNSEAAAGLHAEVDGLITTWTQAAQSQSATTADVKPPAQVIATIAATLSQRILEDRGLPAPKPVAVAELPMAMTATAPSLAAQDASSGVAAESKSLDGGSSSSGSRAAPSSSAARLVGSVAGTSSGAGAGAKAAAASSAAATPAAAGTGAPASSKSAM